MRITFTDRVKALFARDEFDFWFKHFSDQEKELRQMDSWELAKIIHENESSPKRIIAEHLLQVRLVKLQNRSTYIGIFFGLLGVVLGAILTSILK